MGLANVVCAHCRVIRKLKLLGELERVRRSFERGAVVLRVEMNHRLGGEKLALNRPIGATREELSCGLNTRQSTLVLASRAMRKGEMDEATKLPVAVACSLAEFERALEAGNGEEALTAT